MVPLWCISWSSRSKPGSLVPSTDVQGHSPTFYKLQEYVRCCSGKCIALCANSLLDIFSASARQSLVVAGCKIDP
jgi:hypothetical protein